MGPSDYRFFHMPRRGASCWAPAVAMLLLLGSALGALGQAGGVVGGVAGDAQPEQAPVSLSAGGEEMGAPTGTDEDLLDFGSMASGDTKSTNSVGGASVAPTFNFTRAALMRKMVLASAAAKAPAAAPVAPAQAAKPQQQDPAREEVAQAAEAALELGVGAAEPEPADEESFVMPQQGGGVAGQAGAGAQPAAGPAGAGAAAQTSTPAAEAPKQVPKKTSKAVVQATASSQPGAYNPDDASGVADAGATQQAAAQQHTTEAAAAELPQQQSVEVGAAAEVPALGVEPDLAAGNLPPLSAGPAAAGEQAQSSGTGAAAPEVAGVRVPEQPAAAMWGAQDVAGLMGLQEESVGRLPGSMSGECVGRLLDLVRREQGVPENIRSLAELLEKVADIKRDQAQKQGDEVLAAVLADSPLQPYIKFHLEHMTRDFGECQRAASVADARACLDRNKKALSHADIAWFDERFLDALYKLLPDVRSMFGFGSGRGDFERYLFNAGTNYTFGLEPVYLGTLGFYAPGWDYQEGPVQLTALLPDASGLEELRDFRCFMLGEADARVDLVQSFEVMEEIPREQHCAIINALAAMAGRWVTVTMGQLGQGGGHHIANRHKLDFLTEWTRRGLKYREDLTESMLNDCYMCSLHYLTHNLLIFEVDPSRVVQVDCSQEDPANWEPYESFVDDKIFLPNGTVIQAEHHRHDLWDYNYVLRLKAG